MAPLIQSENDKATTTSTAMDDDARKAALEEAAAVLRAIGGGDSSNSGGLFLYGDDSDSDKDDDNNINNNDATAKKRSGSVVSNKEDDANTNNNNNEGAPEDASKVGDNTNTIIATTAATTKVTPKLSRSDAVAAAKRRAEERKRAAKFGGDKRQHQQQQQSSQQATATATASGAALTGTSSHSSSTSTSAMNNKVSNKTPSSYNTKTNTHNPNASMDWFNLLSVVTNPSSGSSNYYHDNYALAASPSSSSHYNHASYHNHRTSRHGGLSSHGTPISLDHVGSDGTRGSLDGGGAGIGHYGAGGENNNVAASLLTAAGFTDWASYANASSASANATFTSVASSLDEFTGWFDHYSRKYLGTVAGIDAGTGGLDGSDAHIIGEDVADMTLGVSSLGNMMAGGIVGASGVGSKMMMGGMMHPSMIVEYEPDFGPEDVPTSQLEELPPDLADLDLASVEYYLRGCGMLGMRFEDRGGGFMAGRERMRNANIFHDGEEEKKGGGNKGGGDGVKDTVYAPEIESKDTKLQSSTTDGSTTATTTNNDVSMASVEETVPEIFFSPYFDLTDPVCFENLLVISDDEVKQIREKEAELHALADQKVKEAEEVAALDAENENVAPRPPQRKHQQVGPDGSVVESGDAAVASGATKSGTSLTKGAKTTSTPTDGNVITLRKPETFTSHLDDIELVLLDQVRSKSERFFRETNRFSELQSLVTTSVDEVRELRTELQSIRERCVTNVEVVPVMDDSRKDLRSISRVLEAVEDVINCKASIASLMGAGDHLGAVEAIRLARSLLAESPEDEDDEDTSDAGGEEDKSSTASHHHQHKHHLSLGKLRALSKVGEQLNEYEKLVVQNLTNELVETFLSWGTDGNIDYRAPPRISLTTDKRAKIRGVVHSLRVCEKLSGAGVAYQRKLCGLISVTVKAIVTECVADAAKNPAGGTSSEGGGKGGNAPKGTMAGVASMSLEQFFDCINMLFEQVLGLLWGAFAVNKFCIDEGFILDDNAQKNNPLPSKGEKPGAQHTPSATAAALAAAADLSEKSVSELLRLRREAHSLVSFDGMRHLWDTSLTFTHQLEKFSGRKAYGLRSTLLAQAKSFIERKHEANMSALVAALDSERWVQCNVSVERQAALTRLCSGRAAFSSRKTTSGTDTITSPGPSSGSGRDKMTDAEVEGLRYKVVWSSLLLLEMVMDDVACAAHFQTLATNVVGKVAELLRLFNTRSTHLVLGAGAIHSAARLKSINAKHLAIITQCIALVLAILPHVRAALMAQLPAKQHALLYDLDKIKADYKEHSEKILSKLVSIIGGIVEHSLAPRIAGTDFDARAKKVSSSDDPNAPIDCCQFLDNVVTNTKKMHQVLLVMLPAELLRDVYSRIFAYLDHKVPSLFKAAASSEQKFDMPLSDDGKLQMIREVEYMSRTLNSLSGVQPWNFTATKILEQELDITREGEPPLGELSVPAEECEPAKTDDEPALINETAAGSDDQAEKAPVESDDQAEKALVESDDQAEKAPVESDDQAEKAPVESDDQAEKALVETDDQAGTAPVNDQAEAAETKSEAPTAPGKTDVAEEESRPKEAQNEEVESSPVHERKPESAEEDEQSQNRKEGILDAAADGKETPLLKDDEVNIEGLSEDDAVADDAKGD